MSKLVSVDYAIKAINSVPICVDTRTFRDKAIESIKEINGVSDNILPANAVLIDSIEWDIEDGLDYGDNDVNLPDSVAIRISHLLHEDESVDDVGVDEMQDRACDYLAEHFGFCFFGCCTELVNTDIVGKETVIL